MSELTRGQKIMAYINAMQDFIRKEENIKLKNDDPQAFAEKLEENFGVLKEKYSMIYDKASKELSPDDYRILKMMLNRIDMMDKDNISEYNASAQVGQELYDKYIKPMID